MLEMFTLDLNGEPLMSALECRSGYVVEGLLVDALSQDL